MVEQFTIEVLKQFREDFHNAVKDMEDKYGIQIVLGNISYNASRFTSKIEVRLNNVSPYQKYEETFNVMHKIYDIDKSFLGKSFKSGRTMLKFVGLDTNKRAYPCICVGINGKQYKMSVEQLKLQMK